MKKIIISAGLASIISQANAAYTTTEIVFRAPTVPKIDKPACAKADILKKITVPSQSSAALRESFEFTYMITLEAGCQGTMTFTSTYDSIKNHHKETISKRYSIKNGALTEVD